MGETRLEIREFSRNWGVGAPLIAVFDEWVAATEPISSKNAPQIMDRTSRLSRKAWI